MRESRTEETIHRRSRGNQDWRRVKPRRRKGIQGRIKGNPGEEERESRRGGEGIQERISGNPGEEERESRRG